MSLCSSCTSAINCDTWFLILLLSQYIIAIHQLFGMQLVNPVLLFANLDSFLFKNF